jgi:ATP-binding cassette subfamily B protein
MAQVPATASLSTSPTQRPAVGDAALQPDDQPAITKLSITAPRRDDDREPDKRPLDVRLILRLWTYTRPYSAKRNWLLLMVVLRAIQLPLVGWMIAAVTNTIRQQAELDSAGSAAAGQMLFQPILWGALGLLALAGTTQIVFHFRQRWALELGEAVIHDLRRQIFAHLQRMPMSYYNKTKLGRIISRVTSDCEALRVGVQDVLFVTLVGVGQMLVAAAIMLYYDWALFGIVAAISPGLWGLNRYFRHRLSSAYRTVQESFSRLTATVAESINGVRVTQAFVREEVNQRLFRDLLKWHGNNVVRAVWTEARLLPLLELNSQIFIAALLVVGGYRVLTPGIAMPLDDLILFFFLANIFFSPIQMLGNQYNQALTAMAGAERVFALLDRPPEWQDEPGARAFPPIEGRVELRNVTFGYEPGRPVLHEINLLARPGECVALVGRTGSGKSSIVNLIARFYLPQAGQVLIDGHDTRHITGDSLHHQMGIVLQQNFLFTGTIAENICVGKPDATDDEVRSAARKLDCLDLLEALPQGLETEVGERGAQLSLGQRQLVCFCRAMLADPRILILDEATSSVDTLTEVRIQAALARLLSGRTSFVVAHRLSTIRSADQVVVLEGGRIVERGTHEELLRHGGIYAGLVRQFARGSAA